MGLKRQEARALGAILGLRLHEDPGCLTPGSQAPVWTSHQGSHEQRDCVLFKTWLFSVSFTTDKLKPNYYNLKNAVRYQQSDKHESDL